MNELNFVEWLGGRMGEVVVNRQRILKETKSCPLGGKKIGLSLTEGEQKVLMILALLRDEYKAAWYEYQRLRPGDQIVLPLQKMTQLAARIRLTEDSLLTWMRSRMPTWTYSHLQLGFDENFEIWVGERVVAGLGDLICP